MSGSLGRDLQQRLPRVSGRRRVKAPRKGLEEGGRASGRALLAGLGVGGTPLRELATEVTLAGPPQKIGDRFAPKWGVGPICPDPRVIPRKSDASPSPGRRSRSRSKANEPSKAKAIDEESKIVTDSNQDLHLWFPEGTPRLLRRGSSARSQMRCKRQRGCAHNQSATRSSPDRVVTWGGDWRRRRGRERI